MKFRMKFPLTGSGKSRIRQKYIQKSRAELADMFLGIVPMTGELEAGFLFFPPDDSQRNQRRDIDNLLKPVLDSLKGIVITDDSQIKAVTANLLPPDGSGRVLIDIHPKKQVRKENGLSGIYQKQKNRRSAKRNPRLFRYQTE